MNDLEGLAAFLEARIAEDERRAIRPCEGVHPSADIYHPDGHPDAFRFAECAAKRDIVAHLRVAIHRDAVALEDLKRCGPDDPRAGAYHLAAITVLEVVTCIAEHAALPYADHPDYNEDWTPENSVAEDMP